MNRQIDMPEGSKIRYFLDGQSFDYWVVFSLQVPKVTRRSCENTINLVTLCLNGLYHDFYQIQLFNIAECLEKFSYHRTFLGVLRRSEFYY